MAAPQNFDSVSRRPPDVEDYIDILRRYRSWVIGPTFAGLVLSVVVAFWWPDMYACTAAMQIKPGAVSANLIPSALSGQMNQRLQQLQLEILGRDNVISLIQNPKLDLYKKERNRLPVEDIAEEMIRKHVRITLLANESDNRGSQAFRIWFEYPDKFKARSVVVELVSQFQGKNVILQSSQANSASTFLDDVVKTAHERMARAQADIATFTAENQGRLPDNFEANTQDILLKSNQVAGLNDQMGQEGQKQALLEGSLRNNKNQQSQAEANLYQTTTTAGTMSVKNTNLVNIEGNIVTKRMELDSLLKRYQPDFPDVLTAKEQLKTLEDRKAQIEKEEGPGTSQAGTSRTAQNPLVRQQLDQLKSDENNILAQISASKQHVDTLRKHAEDLQRELKVVQDKIAASPAVIQRYNALQQEFAMAKEQYEVYSKKKDQTETAQSMEEHRAGETLEILESPITPETPTQPVRSAIIGGGTLMGLVLGVALAGAKEIKNTSLKNLKDVRAYTNLPVLSSIPLLENALLVRRKRRLSWLAWSMAIIVGSILMCGAVYYHMTIGMQVT